jgi:hypothetical protein
MQDAFLELFATPGMRFAWGMVGVFLVFIMAGTCWRCGVALRVMEREDAALERFRKAAELDPHGLYGKLAASAVQGIGRPSLIESH